MSAPGDQCSGLSWTIDAWGNRTNQTPTGGTCWSFNSTVGTNNQLGAPYAYDAAGNMIYDGTHAYTYDAENRIIAVDGGNTATYVYDALGHRVQKIVSGVSTQYYYDPSGNVISEYDGGCGTTCWYTGYIYADGRLKAEYKNGTTYFVHADLLGSTRLLTGYPSPSIIDCDDYYPFGELISCGGSSALRYKFTGKERDSESGLDNFGARYDASTMGRFMSPDPANIGVNRLNPQSWNAYSYALNNPLALTDPTGLYVCEDSTECNSENDKNFAKSLADAQTAANQLKDQYGANSDEYKNAQASIDAYGEKGVDNGVNVRFDSNVTGGVTEASGVANGNKSADNPTGQNINVTFNPSAVGGDFSGGLVAHEGSHVADASAWVASGFSPNMNPTNSTTEFKAYHVQFDVGNALLNMKAGPNGTYTGFINVGQHGQVNWKKGDTFKVITPDLQRRIRENYQNLNSPAFTKGGVLQP